MLPQFDPCIEYGINKLLASPREHQLQTPNPAYKIWRESPLENTFTKTFLNAVILTSIISSRSMKKNFSRGGLLGKLDCRLIGHSLVQSPGILFSGVTERSTLFLSCSMIVVILVPIALFSSLSQRALPVLVPPPAKR